MKKRILFQLVSDFLDGKPGLKKKLLIFSVVAFTGLLVTGALATYALFKVAQVATQTASQITTEALQNEKVARQTQTLWAQVQSIQPVNLLSCWEKTQAIGVTGWIVTPVAQNWQALKQACLPAETKSSGQCKGSECAQETTYI